MPGARFSTSVRNFARRVLPLAAGLALLLGSIAIADRGNPGGGDTVVISSSTAKQVKKLKKQVKRLKKRLGSVESDLGDIELKPGPKGAKGDPGERGVGETAGYGLTNNTPRFFPLNGGSPADTDRRRILSPAQATTLSEFGLKTETAPTGANTLVATVMVNGSASSLTCTIPTGGTACTDDAHTAQVPARSRLSLRVLQTGVVDTLDMSWSVTIE